MEIKGKRFLITHIWLRGYSGAEINILELATYLKSKGAQVTIFTYSLLGEMEEEFQKAYIPVISDVDHEFHLSDFDYIFSAQNIIPNTLIEELKYPQETYPKFFFFHMAALRDHVLEQPYIHELEERLASLYLPVSQEVISNNLNRFHLDQGLFGFYPNPAPESFSNYKSEKKEIELKKILVVSNHPPQEVKDLKEVFENHGISVDYMGVWAETYKLSTVDIFAEYDCIIGIGKNAQYCLSMGIPIFIYDHFAGPGYLNELNFEPSAWYNFSGRNYQKKRSAEELSDEILKGYPLAWEFHQENRNSFRERFSFEKILGNVFQGSEGIVKEIEPFSEDYASYVQLMNTMVKNQIVIPNNDVRNLWNAVHEKESEISRLSEQIVGTNERLNELIHQRDSLEKELTLIKASRSYRFFAWIRRLRKR